MAATDRGSKRHAAGPVDDVPLLVRVLAGNPVTGAAIFSCLNTADTRALRRLHVAVAGVVAGVPWADTATPVVDPVLWRAALPAAVGVRLAMDRFSDAAVAALAGVTRLDLSSCHFVTNELVGRLPSSLRILNVGGCAGLNQRASFVHLTALVSLDCSNTEGAVVGLPPSLQELDVTSCVWFPADISLAHLSQLRVLRARGSALDGAMLASLPPGLVELDVNKCRGLYEDASFAHLPTLQTLHASRSSLWDAALATLPPSLVYLDATECFSLTRAAALPPLPALRQLDVSGTHVGDALVASLPAGLAELRVVQCRGVTARATLDHVRALRALYSMGTALAPAVIAACRARGCAAPAPGEGYGQEDDVTSMVVLADGRLASGGGGGEVRVWDAAAGGDVTVVLYLSDGVFALAALPGGSRLAAGFYAHRGSCVAVWDVTAGTHPHMVVRIPSDSGVLSLAVLADGRLAAGCHDGRVRVVDVGTGAVVAVLGVPSGHVTALAMLPDGALAAGSNDGTVRVWDVSTQVCVAELVGRAGGVRALAVLADGRLACGAGACAVELWDVRSRTCVGTLNGHSGPVAVLAALPDGRLVSATLGEGVIQLWDTRPAAAAAVAAGSRPASVVPVTELAPAPFGLAALVPLPDGRLVCACTTDKSDVFVLEVPPPATYA